MVAMVLTLILILKDSWFRMSHRFMAPFMECSDPFICLELCVVLLTKFGGRCYGLDAYEKGEGDAQSVVRLSFYLQHNDISIKPQLC
jgi:hypothetical protein